MPRPRRLFVNNTVVEVAFRAEENLPLPASPIITRVLWGILAKAQTLYPVELCHFVFMTNHAHMLLVVKDPKDLSDFVGYVKRESAAFVNRLLGRKKHTIWADRFDAPTVLDAEKTMERITYFYTNPQQAGLVDTIDQYPHINSWNALQQGESITRHKRLPRDLTPVLPKRQWKAVEAEKFIAEYFKDVNEQNELTITPFSWMRCFPETSHLTIKEMREQIIVRIRRAEAELRGKRKGSVVGARKLIEGEINARHQPRKWGKRSVCLGSEKRYRKVFIGWFKDIIHHAAKAAEVISKQRWFTKLPPGLFAPSGYFAANVLPWLVPSAWNNFGEYYA